MTVVNFDAEEHLDILNNWLRIRQHPIKLAEDLPENGFVAIEGELPVAMAFLRLCEGNIALFDGLATDPEAPGPLRHKALNEVVSATNQAAKAIDIVKIICWSSDPTVIQRSLSHGYKVMPYTLAMAELSHIGHTGH